MDNKTKLKMPKLNYTFGNYEEWLKEKETKEKELAKQREERERKNNETAMYFIGNEKQENGMYLVGKQTRDEELGIRIELFYITAEEKEKLSKK